jgi:hypothetical protein
MVTGRTMVQDVHIVCDECRLKVYLGREDALVRIAAAISTLVQWDGNWSGFAKLHGTDIGALVTAQARGWRFPTDDKANCPTCARSNVLGNLVDNSTEAVL